VSILCCSSPSQSSTERLNQHIDRRCWLRLVDHHPACLSIDMLGAYSKHAGQIGSTIPLGRRLLGAPIPRWGPSGCSMTNYSTRRRRRQSHRRRRRGTHKAINSYFEIRCSSDDRHAAVRDLCGVSRNELRLTGVDRVEPVRRRRRDERIDRRGGQLRLHRRKVPQRAPVTRPTHARRRRPGTQP